VRPVKRTQTLVPTAVMRAIIVVPIKKQRRKDPLNAFHATTVFCRKKVAPNVKRVERVPMVLDVNPVPKGNTVTAVTQLRSLAEIAQRVTTTTTLVKDPVCHAVPVNSMMLSVLFNVKIVLPIHTTVTKKGNQVASIAQSVGSRWLAV